MQWWTESEAQPGGYYQKICRLEEAPQGGKILQLKVLNYAMYCTGIGTGYNPWKCGNKMYGNAKKFELEPCHPVSWIWNDLFRIQLRILEFQIWIRILPILFKPICK